MKPELEQRCCHNCKKCFMGRYCEKLINENKDYEKLRDVKVETCSFFNDKFMKKVNIEKEYCCDEFESMYIGYPFVVDDVKIDEIKYNNSLSCEVGELVKIRPCDDKNKTYLGVSLGDLPISNSISLNQKDSVLKIINLTNPAFYVFELKKIIFGCESWWGKIKSIDELKDITDGEIANVWYVKLLKGAIKDEKNNKD